MPKFKRSLAVVIGIDHYVNGIPELKTAVNDANQLALILEENYQYQVLRLLDEDATKDKLSSLLAAFEEQTLPFPDSEAVATSGASGSRIHVEPDDRFLFYFAGHGFAQDGLDNPDGPVGFIVPQDARRDDGTWLSMQRLHDVLVKLPCRHLLIILDCCFAGTFRWAGLHREVVRSQKVYRERYDRFIAGCAQQVITSAASDEKAADYLYRFGNRGDNEGHSPFAELLFQALRGEADFTNDEVITATELYVYLRDKITAKQTPELCQLKRHDKGEYIFPLRGFDRSRLQAAPELDEKTNPYKGLASFEAADSDKFFGRTALTQKLQEFVTTHPLTVVLGASGTGKSSLVKAGLIPQKNQQGWRILTPIRPGELPFTALNNTLVKENLPVVDQEAPEPGVKTLLARLAQWSQHNPNSKLLLVIDQCEELVTLCRSDTEREKFLSGLAEACEVGSEQFRLVLTLRNDFEAQLSDMALKPYWRSARFVVPAMTREELREAIVEPAAAKVMYFEPPTLVDELIDEVIQMPGALPLLSFTLSELYFKYIDSVRQGTRSDRAITQADYEQLGGVTSSLTKRADLEYKNLVNRDPAYEQIIKNVMLRMVTVNVSELARRRVLMSELEYSSGKNERVQEVIRQFTEARLLVKGQDSEGNSYVEPAHDALVRGWQKLLTWKQEYNQDLILQRRLTPAAFEWKSLKSKEQSSVFQTKVETVVDWLDNRLYLVENLFNKINDRFVQRWWQRQNQQEGLRDKTIQFLWNSNPYLDVLNKELQSNENWYNQVEAEFVQQSVLQKRRNNSWTWRIAIAVMLSLSGLTIFAFCQWRQAQENTIKALAETSKASLISHGQLEALVTAVQSGKQLQNLLLFPDAASQTASAALQRAVSNVQERNRLESNTSVVYSVVFSPDGKTLASGRSDHSVNLWDVATGKLIKPLNEHSLGVNSVVFSPDGKTLASGSDDNTVNLWDVATGKVINTLKGHSSGVSSVVFSPDGKTLASGSDDNTVNLWDVATGKVINTLKGHSSGVSSVVFSPDGKTLASGSDDNTVNLWNVATCEVINTLNGHKRDVRSVVFSPDGKTLASGSDDNTVNLWDVATGKVINTLKGHSSTVTSVVFSPDGKTLASGGRDNDNSVKLWDVATGQLINTLNGHSSGVFSVVFSPDGKTLASGSLDSSVKLWDLAIGQVIKPLNGHSSWVWSVVFSPDGKTLASGSEDKTVKLWDVATGQVINTLNGHSSRVYSVVFSPDGKTLASGSLDSSVNLWDVATGKLIKPLNGHSSEVSSVVFSPDGKTLASGSLDSSVNLWNVATGKLIKTLNGHSNTVTSVVFSPDGKTLAFGSWDNTVKLWDVATGKLIKTLNEHSCGVYSVVFSPDGETLASSSCDNSVKLWNVATGKLIKTLNGHSSTVFSVFFSPDGKTLASSSNDKSVKLWDVATGQVINTLNGHSDQVRSVVFSPDGKILASGSFDKTVKLWNFYPNNLNDLMTRSCDWLRGYLQTNPNVSDRTLCDGIGIQK